MHITAPHHFVSNIWLAKKEWFPFDKVLVEEKIDYDRPA